jgi:hypothetical protein
MTPSDGGQEVPLSAIPNAAKWLEGNPALMDLRLMKSISSAQNAGRTLVFGIPGGFVPFRPSEASRIFAALRSGKSSRRL